MLRYFIGSLAISLLVILCVFHIVSRRSIQTLTISPRPNEPSTSISSAKARRNVIMNEMLTSEKIRNFTSQEQLFLSKFIVADIAKDLSADLKNKMNAINNDEDDAKHFSMDLINGGSSIALSFRGLSEADKSNETILMEIKRAYALQSGFHVSSINVVWRNNRDDTGMRQLLQFAEDADDEYDRQEAAGWTEQVHHDQASICASCNVMTPQIDDAVFPQ